MTAETDVIALWPSDLDFARDLDVPLTLVRVWKCRKSIPKNHWSTIEQAAKRRKIRGASTSDIARLAKRPSRRQRPAVAFTELVPA